MIIRYYYVLSKQITRQIRVVAMIKKHTTGNNSIYPYKGLPDTPFITDKRTISRFFTKPYLSQ